MQKIGLLKDTYDQINQDPATAKVMNYDISLSAQQEKSVKMQMCNKFCAF